MLTSMTYHLVSRVDLFVQQWLLKVVFYTTQLLTIYTVAEEVKQNLDPGICRFTIMFAFSFFLNIKKGKEKRYFKNQIHR